VIKTIGIIGSGNVAWHLAHAFTKIKSVEISWIYSRNKKTLQEIGTAIYTPTFTQLPQQKVDLIIICASDDELQNIILELPINSKIAYTAGSIALEDLSISHKRVGVFYPLQTFSRQRTINIETVPFLIESFDKEFEIELIEIAKLLSNNVKRSNAKQRQHIHLAAVIANNFANHLLFVAQEYLQKKKIDPNILTPLIKETFEKAIELGTFEGQSGPARRNDQMTISKHLQQLNGNQREIYRSITKNILQTYTKQKKE